MEDDQLSHIGIKRRSGRYPWGSGETPLQRSADFKAYLTKMREENPGITPTEIARHISRYVDPDIDPSDKRAPFKTTDLRAAISSSTEIIRGENIARAQGLKAAKNSASAIGRIMGVNESVVRGWLNASEEVKAGSIQATADVLKTHLETKPYLDVGKGTHLYMGISETKLRQAVASLRDEGYELHPVKVSQLGTDKNTELKILTKEGVTWSQARDAVNRGDLQNILSSSEDGGLTYRTPKGMPPSLNSKRLEVRYADDGGAKLDGVIELRRGVEDLSLGSARYAQVRVAVDGTHYLKGMAMYADDLPAGVDVRFNTNKTKADAPGKLDSLKPMQTITKDDGKKVIDEENPFKAQAKPKYYVDAKGKEKRSPLNIVNEEGDWDKWSDNLSSQMLSKQSVKLASTQLGKARDARVKEFDEIMSLTNPVVRQKLLDDFAETADAAAVHLKGASIDRQSTHVILPLNSIRPTEIYAPDYTQGEKVVLVRHPHGGPFEIPELTVNNNNAQAKRLIKGAKDAVGIHHSVAEQLSGADFDGDTVLVIPNDNRAVKTKPYLDGLKNFDPKVEYREVPGMVYMTKKNTQTEMGKISNLITDMSIKKANESDIAAAVRHSMVVIDAEKHKLNYKQSELDHGIKRLKATYQDGASKGSATLISRSSSPASVLERKRLSGKAGVDPETGEKVFVETGRKYPKTDPKTGEVTLADKITKGTKMEFAKDARDLLSDNPQPIEEVYAKYANDMKALGNAARKASVQIQLPRQSPAARAYYANEVKSLEAKLQEAQRNAPRERQAQVLGNAMARARIDAHPELEKDDIKKIKYAELERARLATGANKTKIGSVDSPITPREWEAIQSGAVSSTRLREILANADMDRIQELASPRPRTTLSDGQMARARALESSGRSLSEIAVALGVPRSTLSTHLSGS